MQIKALRVFQFAAKSSIWKEISCAAAAAAREPLFRPRGTTACEQHAILLTFGLLAILKSA